MIVSQFRNARILFKLMIPFFIFTLVLAWIGFLGARGIEAESQITKNLYTHNVVPLQMLQAIVTDLSQARLLEFAHIATSDPAEAESFEKRIATDSASFLEIKDYTFLKGGVMQWQKDGFNAEGTK